MSLDLINFSSSPFTALSNPGSPTLANGKCNKDVDLNCDGKIESWEKANDIPRIVFGVSSLLLTGHALYVVLANEFYVRTGFLFANWFSAAGTLEMIFAGLFHFPLMLIWMASYSQNLAVLDAFYIFCHVNTWWLATLYWLIWIFYIIHIAIRNNGITVLPDTYDDHSMSVMITMMVLGLLSLVMQTVWADRLNFWYVKQQFLGGRPV